MFLFSRYPNLRNVKLKKYLFPNPSRPRAEGLTGGRLETEGRGVPGGRTSEGGGGAEVDGGQGEPQEGGGGAFHPGHHTGQQPPGAAHGEWVHSPSFTLQRQCSVRLIHIVLNEIIQANTSNISLHQGRDTSRQHYKSFHNE